MDYLYAQLDENNICVGLSQLAGEVDAPHMIRLTEEEYASGDVLGKQYADGAWLEVEQTE